MQWMTAQPGMDGHTWMALDGRAFDGGLKRELAETGLLSRFTVPFCFRLHNSQNRDSEGKEIKVLRIANLLPTVLPRNNTPNILNLFFVTRDFFDQFRCVGDLAK